MKHTRAHTHTHTYTYIVDYKLCSKGKDILFNPDIWTIGRDISRRRVTTDIKG